MSCGAADAAPGAGISPLTAGTTIGVAGGRVLKSAGRLGLAAASAFTAVARRVSCAVSPKSRCASSLRFLALSSFTIGMVFPLWCGGESDKNIELLPARVQLSVNTDITRGNVSESCCRRKRVKGHRLRHDDINRCNRRADNSQQLLHMVIANDSSPRANTDDNGISYSYRRSITALVTRDHAMGRPGGLIYLDEGLAAPSFRDVVLQRDGEGSRE